MRQHHVINTIPHNLNATQVLQQMLNYFVVDKDSAVWVVGPEVNIDRWRGRIDVALSRRRSTLRRDSSMRNSDRLKLRAFRIVASEESVKLPNGIAGILFRYVIKERKQQQIRLARVIEKMEFPWLDNESL